MVLVSAATAWEITTKWRIGKLDGAAEVAADVGAAIASQGFRTLPITIPHAEYAGRLISAHRDPCDRMLVAQSRLEGLPLVSNDLAFDEFAIERSGSVTGGQTARRL